jgi:hypothetical protein
MASDEPSVISIHTPSSSLALNHSGMVTPLLQPLGSVQVHLIHSSATTETLTSLFDKLSRKRNTEFYRKRVGPGWLKYEWNGSVWNLDDGAFHFVGSTQRTS